MLTCLSFFLPTLSLITTLSASSAGESSEAVGKSWGFDLLRGSVPFSVCLKQRSLGEEQQSWPQPGPTCLPLWRVHHSQGQWKRSGVCALWSRLCAVALHLVPMIPALRERDNPAFKPALRASRGHCTYPLLAWSFMMMEAVSGCIFNPILFSVLNKIRLLVGKQLLWIELEAVN